METGTYTFPKGRYYVRVSGPQVGLNKSDHGDRPCMYLFEGGEEWMGHEVVFHGETRLLQEFNEGCPATGAILWLETDEPVTLIVRENHDLHAHVEALQQNAIDDVPRS